MGYLNPIIAFKDSLIYQQKMVVTKSAYPSSNFTQLSTSEQIIILKNFCRPYIENMDFKLLLPNASVQIISDFNELTYTGFLPEKSYHGEVTFYVSDELRKFCSRIWTGTINKNFSFSLSKSR